MVARFAHRTGIVCKWCAALKISCEPDCRLLIKPKERMFFGLFCLLVWGFAAIE